MAKDELKRLDVAPEYHAMLCEIARQDKRGIRGELEWLIEQAGKNRDLDVEQFRTAATPAA